MSTHRYDVTFYERRTLRFGFETGGPAEGPEARSPVESVNESADLQAENLNESAKARVGQEIAENRADLSVRMNRMQSVDDAVSQERAERTVAVAQPPQQPQAPAAATELAA